MPCFLSCSRTGALLGAAGLALMLALAAPDAAQAQSARDMPTESSTYVQQFTNFISDSASDANEDIQNFAMGLFGVLVTLELLMVGFSGLLGLTGTGEMLGRAFKRLVIFAVLSTAILSYSFWFPPIINSFRDLGQTAGGYTGDQTGNVLASRGEAVIQDAYWAAEEWATDGEPYTIVGYMPNRVTYAYGRTLVAGFVLQLAFLLASLQLFYVEVEAAIATFVGMVVLGFAPFRSTASLAEKYVGYLLQIALKLFLIYFICGIIQDTTAAWPGYIDPDSTTLQPGELIERVWVMGIGSIFLGIAAVFLPPLIARKITRGFDLGLTQALSD